VVQQQLGLDPAAPLRNITSGTAQARVQLCGFSNVLATQTFIDAMKPNLEFNERQTVVYYYSVAFPNSTGWEA